MREPIRDHMRLQLPSGRRTPAAALLPGAQSPRTETPIPGHLCEVCLDAPAVAFVPAPEGGEMGVCEACGAPPVRPVVRCVTHPLDQAHSPTPARYGKTVAVTCGVCGVRGVTTAVLWQAEQERRRALADTSSLEEA